MGLGYQLLIVFLISMVPVIELRGALPVAMLAGIPWYIALPVVVVGNMLPVPFILLFIRKIFQWMKKHTPLGGLVERLEKKGQKSMAKIKRFELAGLTVFVAVPLPGTGAWTGALAAALMDLRLKTALPAIALGVAAAGVIVTVLFYFFPFLLGL